MNNNIDYLKYFTSINMRFYDFDVQMISENGKINKIVVPINNVICKIMSNDTIRIIIPTRRKFKTTRQFIDMDNDVLYDIITCALRYVDIHTNYMHSIRRFSEKDIDNSNENEFFSGDVVFDDESSKLTKTVIVDTSIQFPFEHLIESDNRLKITEAISMVIVYFIYAYITGIADDSKSVVYNDDETVINPFGSMFFTLCDIKNMYSFYFKD